VKSYFMITQDVQVAKKILQAEGVAAIPTETVYGLAARIDSPTAIKKIFATKGRPFFDPLIVHIPDSTGVMELVTDWPSTADVLAKEFWPGPLTLVLPKSERVDSVITAGLSTVAIRVPNHPMTLTLLKVLGVPLAAPSANRYGKVSPTTAQHVRAEFDGELLILDGGPSNFGVESTVVRPTEDVVEILRPGMVTAQMIEKVLKKRKIKAKVARALSNASPGHADQHYQPKVPLLIVEEKQNVVELAGKFSAGRGVEMELHDDPIVVARFLYAQLRQLSDSSEFIFVKRKTSQSGGHWDAIWDRLERAQFR
jgi:L-threonylcarbamoyladenylate synthase